MRVRILVMMVFSLLMVREVAAGTVPEDIYKEAQLQESTVHDLDAASRLYAEFLTHAGTDRALQANATLHLGLCEAKRGNGSAAKVNLRKVIQDFSDQSEPYSQALSQLQIIQAQERVVVTASTPVVKVVYAIPSTRWALEWLDFSYYHVFDHKGRFFDYDSYGVSLTLPHSLSYYVNPNVSVGIEGRQLFSTYETFESNTGVTDPLFGFTNFPVREITRSIAYIAPVVRVEKRMALGLTPYLKFGPAAYRFHFDGDFGSSTKWTPGIVGEAGLALGWPRGFTLTFGYSVLGFSQKTPEVDLSGVNQTAYYSVDKGSITENHGWRWLGGPSLKLGYRW